MLVGIMSTQTIRSGSPSEVPATADAGRPVDSPARFKIAADPKLLVLDEATSAIDVYTEAVLEKALRKLIKGRTTIIIAHRLSTIRHADRILVLEQGNIIEDGSHEELVKNEGEYAQMVEAGKTEPDS